MNVFKLIEDNGLKLDGDIEHFAELVRADEREACAKVCESMDHDGVMIAANCAKAIRARGRTVAKPMTKTEWMNWVEEAWNKAQQSAWAEKREWVSLTDEEFDQVLKEFSHDPRAMAIELEIRIMEKNTCTQP